MGVCVIIFQPSQLDGRVERHNVPSLSEVVGLGMKMLDNKPQKRSTVVGGVGVTLVMMRWGLWVAANLEVCVMKDRS